MVGSLKGRVIIIQLMLVLEIVSLIRVRGFADARYSFHCGLVNNFDLYCLRKALKRILRQLHVHMLCFANLFVKIMCVFPF